MCFKEFIFSSEWNQYRMHRIFQFQQYRWYWHKVMKLQILMEKSQNLKFQGGK